MTPEVEKLITENHALIYHTMKIMNINNFDDYYGAGAIGLCKAAETFDKTREIAFSTYAVTCISSYIRKEFDHENRLGNIPRNVMYSLDCEYNISDSDNNLLIMNSVPALVNVAEEAITNVNLDRFIKNLNNEDRIIICMKANGYSQVEISKYFNISAESISVKVKRLKKKFKTLLKLV